MRVFYFSCVRKSTKKNLPGINLSLHLQLFLIRTLKSCPHFVVPSANIIVAELLFDLRVFPDQKAAYEKLISLHRQ